MDKNTARFVKGLFYLAVAIVGITSLTMLPEGNPFSMFGGFLTGFGLTALGYTCAEMILIPRIEFLEEKLKSKQ